MHMQPSEKANAGRPGQAAPVLMIDDDASMRMLAATMLRAQGFEVTEADSGEAGLRALEQGSYAAVVLDLRMPGMNGFEVCTAMRRRPGCEDMPIVVLSGREDGAGIEAAYAAGATDYLCKPVNWTQLVRKLQLVISAWDTSGALVKACSDRDALVDMIPDTVVRFCPRGTVEEWVEGAQCPPVLTELLTRLAVPGGGHRGTIDTDLLALARRGGEHDFELEGDATRHYFQVRATLGASGSAFMVIRDITEKRANEQQLETLALRDTVTGMGNRHWVHQRCTLLQRAASQGTGRAVVYRIVLENAEESLELFGEQHFDHMMRQLAQRLVMACRIPTYQAVGSRLGPLEAGRTAAGEFTVLQLAQPEEEPPEHFAAKISQILTCSLWLEEELEIVSRVRVGVATLEAGQDAGEDLFQRAGIAALQSDATASRVCRYHSDEKQSRMANLDLESRLRRGLRQGELFLHYQPQFSSASGVLTGFEALLRWESEGKMISPAEFIPVAERSGMILEIGDLVLDRACRQIADWRGGGYEVPVVAINLSALQLAQGDMLQRLQQKLQKYRVPPSCLEIEITESLLLENSESVQEALEGIRAAGVKIALDDFGTGYSSLGYLHRHPLDVVKIDRSFVSGLPHGNRSENIIRAIIGMARALCMQVVAEGVETPEQLAFLEGAGCDFIQGFLTGRPQSALQATSLLARAANEEPGMAVVG